ncbi:MAG: hypothetical protein R2813_03020 [Flavobacteriales bacterium]
MNRFLFITTTSPKSCKIDSLRNQLYNRLFFKRIAEITYPNVEFWIIGEVPENQSKVKNLNIRFFDTDKKTKGDRLREVYERLKQTSKQFDYISRLDDDDILSISVLEKYAHSAADLIMDRYHTFLDITSGRYGQQRREWVANTAFHKYEHAMQIIDPENGTGLLFDYDHAKSWINYYQEKQIEYTSKEGPIYMRVLNPHSITALGGEGVYSQQDFEAFFKYLRAFGYFQAATYPKGFEHIYPDVMEIVKSLDFPENTLNTRPSVFNKIISRLR